MYNYKPILVENLDNILPTYYELFVDSKTPTPCITYIEANNSTELDGETMRYSRIAYLVKVWGNDLAQLIPYFEQVDNALFQAGFHRVSYNELSYNNQLCLIGRYEARALEFIGG